MIAVTRDPHRQLSKLCGNCRGPATYWLTVGDDNQRVVVALCDSCAQLVCNGLKESNSPSLEEKLQREGHSGIAAVWCPVCGSCTCPRDSNGDWIEDAEAKRVAYERRGECPLHEIGPHLG